MARIEQVMLRPEEPGDEAAIGAVLAAAFGRQDAADLVARLRAAAGLTISLVAVAGGAIAGHAALSPITIEGAEAGTRWFGLAPVAVRPDHQRQGIGTRLVEEILQQATALGASAVFVLGDPGYYWRFGFAEAGPQGWRCLYDAPSAAFRVALLGPRTDPPPPGVVRYHPAFDEP
ncbi:GNAT family N-acetyltransferase [Benzoatithermus flavus]|uniref:N-acetyltransferase n=1 Tax=Benzoatithermus flavus TaxID=3108223 RepID=A0ABU8XWZ4_9PROT